MELPRSPDATRWPELAASFFRPLQDHVHRLERLDLWYTPLSVYQGFFNSPALNLEELYASGAHDGVAVEPSDTPSILFGGHMPRLRKLFLGRMCLSLDFPISANLIYLQIENVIYTRSQPSHLIQALNACPALERFQLTNVHFRSAFLNPTMQANLPRLQHIFLYEMPLEVVRYTLASIIICPTACLSLNLSNATVDATFPPNEDCVTRFPNIPRIRHLSVVSIFHLNERDNMTVAGYDGLSSRRGDSAQLLTLEFQNMQPSAMESVLSTLKRLPMPLLESLELRVGFAHAAFTAAKVSHFLADFATIKTFSLRDKATRFIDIFVVSAESHLCPSLETLRIRRSDVGVEALVEVVKSRQTFGCPLVELELEDCKLIDRASIEQLEVLGVTVKWTGPEEYEGAALDPHATYPNSSN